MLNQRNFKPGDWVIFRKTKSTPHPGKRAENIVPARAGDSYTYTVDKFWIVQEVHEDGNLLLRTRRGKLHVVSANDPSLRMAGWWDRFRYRSRYEALEVERKKAAESGANQELPKHRD